MPATRQICGNVGSFEHSVLSGLKNLQLNNYQSRKCEAHFNETFHGATIGFILVVLATGLKESKISKLSKNT